MVWFLNIAVCYTSHANLSEKLCLCIFLIEGVLSKGTGEHLRELQNLNLTDSQSAVLTLIQNIFTPTEGKGY